MTNRVNSNSSDVPCLELRNVMKSFQGVAAVDHISLKVENHRIFSLLGPSGCGKSTTLRIVAGLEQAEEGQILIDGKIVNDIPPYRRDCSMVFQSFALFPHMTVGGNVSYGLERKRVPRPEVIERVTEILKLVGLQGMENRYPNQLSGGQRQRVALARSLVIKPKILLLDEPLASLDRKLRKEMQGELKRLQREVGITFLYVTHDQKEALSISDSIAVMRKGKMEQVGTPERIYRLPSTEFVADFMGASNIFRGKVQFRGNGIVNFMSEDGLGILANDNIEIEPQDVKGISVHPECIDLLLDNPDREIENLYKGKIVEMTYQGDFIDTRISLEQSSTVVNSHLDSRLGKVSELFPGRDILVHISSQNCNILRG